MKKILDTFIFIAVACIGITISLIWFQGVKINPEQHITTSQFGVYNNCPYTIWIQAQNQPSADLALIKLSPQAKYNYHIYGQLLPSFAVIPKSGCDKTGNNCIVGQSLPPCPAKGCQLGIDSRFEATFNDNGTFFDTSNVNGYTLANKLNVIQAQNEDNVACTGSDASYLDLSSCPVENLSTPLSQMKSFGNLAFGDYKTYKNISLTAVDLRVNSPINNKPIGCASPEMKLISLGIGANESNIAPTYYNKMIMYSCPFTSDQLLTDSGGGTTNLPLPPHNLGFNNLSKFCNANGYCQESNPNNNAASNICKLGPIVNTKYVKYIHSHTIGNYAYPYDDVNGSHVCNSSQSSIVWELCPPQILK